MNKKELLAKAKIASALIDDREAKVILSLLVDLLKIDIDEEKPSIGFGGKDSDANRKA